MKCVTADRQLQSCFDRLLSQFIYSPSSYTEEQEKLAQKRLMDTQIAQPAIGAIEAGFMDLMQRLQLVPSMVCGHSYGEYAALHWQQFKNSNRYSTFRMGNNIAN